MVNPFIQNQYNYSTGLLVLGVIVAFFWFVIKIERRRDRKANEEILKDIEKIKF